MKLTQEIKDAWIENLRSGEIEQYTGGWDNRRYLDTLVEKSGNVCSCCLDVLSLQLTGRHYLDINDEVERTESLSTPESQLLRDVGFSFDVELYVEASETVNDLIELNDEEGYNFAQIADWIEKNVKVVDDSAGD